MWHNQGDKKNTVSPWRDSRQQKPLKDGLIKVVDSTRTKFYSNPDLTKMHILETSHGNQTWKSVSTKRHHVTSGSLGHGISKYPQAADQQDKTQEKPQFTPLTSSGQDIIG